MRDKEIEERIDQAKIEAKDEAKAEGKGERRAYIVLVVISVILSFSVLMFGIYRANLNNHKFCDLFVFVLTEGPAPHKPADPKANPKLEKAYEGYAKFKKLTEDLGCIK